MELLAPIILFVYNRPVHTQTTLKALQANELANKSLLYIYADGPKENASDQELANIEKTRRVLRKQQWGKEVIIRELENNKGLADSIVEGVTEVVNKHDKVIVLEDDVVTSSGFLTYMNDALKLYENEESVMHVSGYMFPVKDQLPETFFYNTASCWGWATWKRAWKYFREDASRLAKEIEEQNRIYQFNIEDSYPFFKQLSMNASGQLKTWAVRWYASIFLQKGYALHPYPSLVNNIGMDGSGENHKSSTDYYHWHQLAENINVKPILIEESVQARRSMANYYKAKRPSKKPVKSLKHKAISILPKKGKLLLKKFYSTQYRKYIQEINRLANFPRYTPTTTNLLDKPLKIIDAASFSFIYKEIFEQEVYNFQTVNEKPYILDCGANIGVGIIYFKKKYPLANIVAFEPDDKIFSALQENMNSFGYHDVQLIKKGLWNKETKLRFFSEGADSGHVVNQESENNIEIETTRLRTYLKKEVDFLKMDIEGAETEVLLDSRDLLSNVNRIFIEYHSFNNKMQTLNEILDVLREAGFRYYFTTPGLVSKNPFLKVREYMNMDLQVNIYGIRRSG